MKRILPFLLIAIVVCTCSNAQTPDKPRWEDLSRLLGQLDTSRELSDLRGTDKPQRIERGPSEYQLFFDERGYSLRFLEGRLKEIVLRLAPGKGLRESPYTGTLPLGIEPFSLTPEEAIQRFGPPLLDAFRGAGELKYERAGLLITLCFAGDHFEFIAIASK